MRVYFDVDTQQDFMDVKGAMYLPDAESIRSRIAVMTSWSLAKEIPVIGTVDYHYGTEKYAHREHELERNNGPFPDHCMIGTWGAEKIPETICARPVQYAPHRLDNTVDDRDIGPDLRDYAVYFEKQKTDAFSNPALERFITERNVTEAIVYGVATDICVLQAITGLQERGVKCYVLYDAVIGTSRAADTYAIKKITERGAVLQSMDDVIQGRI